MRKALVVIVALVGCGPARLPGAPGPGTPCAADSAAECTTDVDVAYCEAGKWAEYACPSECRNAQSPRCNWELSTLGDACPKSLSGTLGFCATALRMFRCDGGRFVATECPGGCTKTGDFFQCRP